MNKDQNNSTDPDDEMLPEYDFSGKTGVRGKYYQALRQGYTIRITKQDGSVEVQHVPRPEGIITLDPDVQEYFPDSEAVNTALRSLIRLIPKKNVTR
jgi:hypothetical protein